MNAPLMIPTLADRALLVNLKVGVWDAYAFDKVATVEGFGSTDLGRANKSLLKHSTLYKKTKAAFTSVRAYVNYNTVPWKDNGVRLLPSTSYFDFTQGLAQVKAQADAALELFAQGYDTEVANDKIRFDAEAQKTGRPSLFNALDYPADIRSKFYVSVGFEPIPSSKDFRVQISDEDKAALDMAVLTAQEEVTNHLIEEMVKPLQALAAHLQKPVDDVKRFHDSLVTNVFDAADRLGRLNINGSQEVRELIDQVRSQLAPYNHAPEILKDSQASRDEARAKLNSMLGSLGIR